MSPMLLDFSSAEENNVYATDQLSNQPNSNDTMPAIVIDSDGNLHSVWVRNNQHLFYSMQNLAGQTLIQDTQITNPGSHLLTNPTM
ncbi:hypothetical protein OAJ94_02060, partial [Deltaproteobacteria bacterium]|nr:hypothetical protein [Deltaproteobacteria bacterium]